jgi:hypothetical protein
MKNTALQNINSCVELNKLYLKICQFYFMNVWLRSYSWSKYIHFADFHAKKYDFGRFLSLLFYLFAIFSFLENL